MPYDPKELVALPADVVALVAELRAATALSGDGGAKVTREERRRIIRAAARLAWVMARDALD